MEAVASFKELLLRVVHYFRPNADDHSVIYTASAVAMMAVLAWIVFQIARFLLEKFKLKYLLKGHRSWQEELVKQKFFRRLSHVFPAVVLFLLSPILLESGSTLLKVTRQGSLIYLLVAVLLALYAILNTLEHIYNDSRMANRAPITGFIQVSKLTFTLIISLLIISVMLEKSPAILLSGLTAIAAVVMLIFRDTILGFVGGIQIAANRMVNTGDWIEVPKFGADGEVREIGLTVVKVQNWDNTISTLPTYSLTTEAVKNWRGMSESGGRRIKRSINIDINSCRFCDQDMLAHLSRFHLLKDYLADKKTELEQYNKQHEVSVDDLANSRRLTNIGTFRVYVESYLRQHPQINQHLTLMVRQLRPTETGLPLEIYCFSANKKWVEYEGIQADIFDHILSMLPEFGLRAYQRVSDKQ